MKYLVMECHLSHSIVLDEEGRFLKVANQHHTVGQTVTEVVQMQDTPTTSAAKIRLAWVSGFAAIAACLVLVMTSLFTVNQPPYASVYMSINPEVRIDVNQKNTVIKLDGLNAEGDQLIEGYAYRRKQLDPVVDALVNRAINLGYLSAGGQITLTLDAEDDEWIVSTSDSLDQYLNESLADTIPVDIQIQPATEQPITTTITVPIPSAPSSSSDSNDISTDEDDAQSETVVRPDMGNDTPSSSTAESIPDGHAGPSVPTDAAIPNVTPTDDFDTEDDDDGDNDDFGTEDDDDGFDNDDFGTEDDDDGFADDDFGTENDDDGFADDDFGTENDDDGFDDNDDTDMEEDDD